MSTLLAELTVVPGAVGPAISTANLAAQKTLIVSGVSGTFGIEASSDGINFCNIHTFQPNNDNDEIVTVAAAFMRANATLGGAATACVVAEEGITKTGIVPAPPADGPGAALDITEFGPETTVYVSNIPLGGSVGIEISCDGTKWSSEFQTFQKNECDSKNVAARFIRAVGIKSGGVLVGVTSQRAESIQISPTQIIYRMDAANPGGNVYATWDEAFAAATAALASAQGKVAILFDNSESTYLNGGGIPANPITPGLWDITDIELSTVSDAFGGFGGGHQYLEFMEGATLTGQITIKGSEWDISTAATVAGGFLQTGFVFFVGADVVYCRSYGHADRVPLYKQGRGFGFFELAQTCSIMQFGDPGPGPKSEQFDANGGYTVMFLDGGAWVIDGALTNSSGFGIFDFSCSAEGAGIVNRWANWNQPGMATGAIFGLLHEHRALLQLSPAGAINDTQSPYDGTQEGLIDFYRVDASADDVILDLPHSSPMAGRRVFVKDVSVPGSGFSITVNTSGTDVFDDNLSPTTQVIAGVASGPGNVLKLVSDGFGTWFIV
jgi:hypothetical protein